MALSFFRALNPVSENSGITYCHAYREYAALSSVRFEYPCQNQEMKDSLVSEQIGRTLRLDLTFFQGLIATYSILVGTHFDLPLEGSHDCHGGAKGALDFLLFPLVARKLIADTYLEENKDRQVLNTLSWMIAVPLEALRFSAAIALTLLLAPFVALVHLIKGCIGGNAITETEEDQWAYDSELDF